VSTKPAMPPRCSNGQLDLLKHLLIATITHNSTPQPICELGEKAKEFWCTDHKGERSLETPKASKNKDMSMASKNGREPYSRVSRTNLEASIILYSLAFCRRKLCPILLRSLWGHIHALIKHGPGGQPTRRQQHAQHVALKGEA
jgi:hypothetical protein